MAACPCILSGNFLPVLYRSTRSEAYARHFTVVVFIVAVLNRSASIYLSAQDFRQMSCTAAKHKRRRRNRPERLLANSVARFTSVALPSIVESASEVEQVRLQPHIANDGSGPSEDINYENQLPPRSSSPGIEHEDADHEQVRIAPTHSLFDVPAAVTIKPYQPTTTEEGAIDSSEDEIEMHDVDRFTQFIDNPLEVFDGLEDPRNNSDSSNDSSSVPLAPSIPANPTANEEENTLLASKIVASVKNFLRRPTMLGIISLYGKCRYTVESYEHMVAMKRDRNDEPSLPCITTMRNSVFPRLLQTLFVPSIVKEFPLKDGYYYYSTPGAKKKQSEACVVLPSSWAKLDVSSLHVLREIACIDSCRCTRDFGSSDLRVDSSTHVLKRCENSTHSDVLWVNKQGVPVPASTGTIIQFHTSILDEDLSSTISAQGISCMDSSYRGEQCASFVGEVLGTFNVLFSSERGAYIEPGIESCPTNGCSLEVYDSCIAFIESLLRTGHESASQDLPTEAVPPPQTRRKRKRAEGRGNRLESTEPYLLPTDHLTILKLGSPRSLGIYVSRYWINRLDDERNFFLLLNVNSDGTISCTTMLTFGSPVFVRELTASPSDLNNTSTNACTTTGKLESGQRFYIYRMLLYADDFNARSPLFPKGSVGGIYMSPSSVSVKSRCNQSCIRTVSLTPAGVSTNNVLDYLLDDLVEGSISGFDCVDALGETVRVYLDVLGFTGDYPASTSVVDLKGHNAMAPCTKCGFTFNSFSDKSKYAFTTSVTSRNSAYRRSQDRANSLRNLKLDNKHNKLLGLSNWESGNLLSPGRSPLLKFAALYNEKRNTENLSHPHALCKLDGYSLNLIAPDHLLSGLFKGILFITFQQLADDNARDRLQISLKATLSEYGYQSQKVLYNLKKKKIVPGLSMSMLYCVLVVFPTSLQALNLLDDLPCKKLITNFHRFFSLLFWWPSIETDGTTAWSAVHGFKMADYHRLLQVSAANFVKSIDSFVMSYPELGCHVDRPNAHRVLELVHHTIPLFNHVTFVCELVFEAAHQPLKFFLSRNTTLNSHLHAVQLVLAKDWMVRLWSLWRLHKEETETPHYRELALIGIIRLMGGREADKVTWTSSSIKPFLDELRDHVYDLLEGTVIERFDKWYQDARPTYGNCTKWALSVPTKGFKITTQQEDFLCAATKDLAQSCLQRVEDIHFCDKAFLERGGVVNRKVSNERLQVGDIVQVLLKQERLKDKFLSSSNSDTPHFFLSAGSSSLVMEVNGLL